jgi:hypothetical protein
MSDRASSEEGGQPEDPFYRRTWVLVALCMFVPPVGVGLLWLLQPRPYGDIGTWALTFVATFCLITYIGEFTVGSSGEASEPTGADDRSETVRNGDADEAGPEPATSPRLRVSRQDFEEWPPTVNSGELWCVERHRAVIFAANGGGTYAVNQAGQDLGYPRLIRSGGRIRIFRVWERI